MSIIITIVIFGGYGYFTYSCLLSLYYYQHHHRQHHSCCGFLYCHITPLLLSLQPPTLLSTPLPTCVSCWTHVRVAVASFAWWSHGVVMLGWGGVPTQIEMKRHHGKWAGPGWDTMCLDHATTKPYANWGKWCRWWLHLPHRWYLFHFWKTDN